ncbi:MAG: DinB family protein [Sneathiella sp.]
MLDHFKKFALYNRWANDRLYSAIAELSSEEQHQDLGAFFGSLNGTLNHVLVGDLLWMERFDGKGPKPATLDTVLHEDFKALKIAREEADERLSRLVSACSEDYLCSYIDYKTSAGIACRDRVSDMLGHMFNHQTHHRGQCHHMLSQLGKSPPPLDIIYLLREMDQ